jgi:hypothetical protein
VVVLSLKRTTGYGRSPTERKPVFAVGSTITKSRMQLAFIAMAIGALPVRSCSPQYFGPKNTGEDCELADKKKNDNRVLHDLALRGVDVGYRHRSDCACSSRRGCSKLLTIDNRASR